MADLVREWGSTQQTSATPYHREPFAVDVSEGKTDPLYKAHSYHTKVPHLAIVPSILHYTKPGDIVLDGFCGSGMTGVAAQWCGRPPKAYKETLEAQCKQQDRPKPEWGSRRVILNDLSPAASFIAANYNLPFDVREFANAGEKLLKEVETDLGWMYETLHTDGQTKGRIEYTVWSEVFTCPECAGEVVFLDEAMDEATQRVKSSFPCPKCHAELSKPKMDRLYETRYDAVLRKSIKTPKRVPSLIFYDLRGQTCRKVPDTDDLKTLERIAKMPLPSLVPTGEIPFMHMTHQRARMSNFGITHLHHFFLPRAAHSLASLWKKAASHADARTRHMLLFMVDQGVRNMSLLNAYEPLAYSQNARGQKGVYYVPSQHAEVSPGFFFDGKLRRLVKAFSAYRAERNVSASGVGTAARLNIPDSSVDYIFTDPPFGENIYYSDMNYLVESWHRIVTQAKPEAIVDKAKKKGLSEYQQLMRDCFAEYCRVLKAGRWMTVVFHNSRNAVWTAIQEAMTSVGFVVAGPVEQIRRAIQASY